MSHNSHSNDIDDSPGNDEQSKNGVYAHAIGVEDPSGFIESQYRLLVPVLSESPVENVERIMRSAATIALDREGDLLVLCLVDVPQQIPYEAMTKDQPRVRDAHETAERLFTSPRMPASQPTGSSVSPIGNHTRSSTSPTDTTATACS